LTENGSNRISKFDTIGTSLSSIGGYGWNASQFDLPVDLYSTPLKILVSDKNNHRIQQLDKDLNFISILSTKESKNKDEVFGYPLSAVFSSMGDLFILDSENKRIIKFDLFGNFNQYFAGFDAGVFALKNPIKLSISGNNRLFVLDGKWLKVYDNFGNGILNKMLEKEFTSINILSNIITLTSKNEIYIGNLLDQALVFQQVLLIGDFQCEDFVSSIFYNEKLYVLTSTQVHVFKKQ
jgi:hypothetical protein